MSTKNNAPRIEPRPITINDVPTHRPTGEPYGDDMRATIARAVNDLMRIERARRAAKAPQ
jgi:hypothetical protein